MKADSILQLPRVGIIKVSGPDAAGFLNNQLSNDILHMNKNEVKIAAYCSPQGRVLASFLVLQTQPEAFLLLCCADIVEDTLKRLKMFVLRSKVELSDVSGSMQAYGTVTLRDSSSPALTPWTYDTSDELTSIELPYVANMLRHIVLTSHAENLPPSSKPLPIKTWTWLYVRSGIAMINQSIKEQYLPQMLNYESVGAIDFKKGCYPGQEVISRSQFRGSLKKHAYIIHADQEIKQGAEIYIAAKKDEEAPSSMGEVVTSAPNPDGGWDSIAVLRIEAESSKLTLTPETPQLEETMVSILPLPYERVTDF